jgi:hypothetical protein
MNTIEIKIHFQSQKLIEHYGGKNYEEIKDKFNKDFWDFLYSNLGKIGESEHHLIAWKDFLYELKRIKAVMLCSMNPKMEYQGEVITLNVPVSIDETEYDQLNSDGNGPVEKRMERLIARKFRDYYLLPVVFRDSVFTRKF